MAEFSAITTQEQLDAIITDRLKREREKYADYETLKNDAANRKKQIDDLIAAGEESARKSAESEKKLTELQAKVKDYETAAMKTKIALETGLPYELSSRLNGESEADIRKDAESMAKYLSGGTRKALAKKTDPDGQGGARASLAALATSLTSNE